MANVSLKTIIPSRKETLCFRKLRGAFSASHSNSRNFSSIQSRVYCNARHLAAVAAFSRRQHAQGFGPVDYRNGGGAEAALAAARFVFQSTQHFLRSDRHFVDTNSDRVVQIGRASCRERV